MLEEVSKTATKDVKQRSVAKKYGLATFTVISLLQTRDQGVEDVYSALCDDEAAQKEPKEHKAIVDVEDDIERASPPEQIHHAILDEEEEPVDPRE